MKVKFLPDGQEFEIKPNQTVLQVAHENGLHIQSVCKGIPSCSECRVNVSEGEYNLLPPSETELQLIGTAYFVDQRRLACQLRCFGDVTIDLTGQNEKADEAVSSKRPRGYGPQKDASESNAVMGNIMQDEAEQSRADVNERTVNVSIQAEETRRELERIKAKKSGGSRRSDSDRRPKRGDSDRGGRPDRQERSDRKPRPQKNRKPEQKASGEDSSAGGSEKSGEKKPNRNRNRNRNRRGKGRGDKGSSKPS